MTEQKYRLAAHASATVLALASLGLAAPALAQSTGSMDFGNQIVVTGTAQKGIVGVANPDTSKASAILSQAWIERQTPGQSINDMINYLPGVSFQNNDPYGGSGGTLMIRGFDATRISETIDGVTLNDDGNYALYSGELLDSEVIDQVAVNFGTTDVDSPTSSASGSTINIRSHKPTEDFHLKASGAMGTDNYYRVMGMVDSGAIGPAGTRLYGEYSHSHNDSPFNNYGKVRREQANGGIYQPLGANGDFLSLTGTYVGTENNFSGSVPLSNVPLTADTGVGFTYFPTSFKNGYYHYAPCTTAAANAGTADNANTCGSAYDYRVNPAQLLNLRGSARLTLAPGLVWTIDPSYQWTKANGGGTVVASEGTSAGMTGYVNGSYYLGEDLNGDGDTLDKVRLLAPSQTTTHRIALTTSMRYDIDSRQAVRIAYAFARSVISQTGELGMLNSDGSPMLISPINDPLTDGAGNVVEKRDTRSIALLNQVSAEYRGSFLDNRLKVNAGLRAPFMHRDLTNDCFTRSSSGGVSCVFGASAATYAAANPSAVSPQRRTYNYNAVLPSLGVTYDLPSAGQIFFNYSKGMSVPQTTSLYQSFYFANGSNAGLVDPEKTDNFDLGFRRTSGPLQAQADLWYTHFTNRLGTAYQPDANTAIYTNLGTVDRYGIDANVSYRFTSHVSGYVFGSWLHSRIKDNVDSPTGELATAGKFESAVPITTVGARLSGNFQPFTLGVQVKRTGPRYVNDQNTPYYLAGTTTVAYGAKTPSYTLVDLDARVALGAVGLNDRSYLQLNVTNLFNQYYAGGFSGTFNNQVSYTGSYTNVQIGAPRAAIATLVLAY
ncbi:MULTISPECIES: TonB-dependent receptor [unclassified Novosphingobium]|uniref:TonB-dependent receptor n=1 Tax=unclassified Novosphingobium TaxID=2644732 RepID=UPI001494F4E7|nr:MULTISPECIES: TonB-dependent receptor [unclassified Novosphingobium]MBB3358475.1 iron complex outermembrane receptor protein [Novosphingobium sp. BK256]MBB3374836.1 iron complex outermembrane receptor protein [Novosphingobium sp. BK280]MBB3379475.1 iron complex outermembrane receptor protein [Novosphingobium sp. BK258]MBB3421170.1 iron complex outermembrane receptor protein [Novosphingobium sp. BK267]MBB3449257.1 iron complex outermembrane receptor protein [Novosphingobium sp. BK352]